MNYFDIVAFILAMPHINEYERRVRAELDGISLTLLGTDTENGKYCVNFSTDNYGNESTAVVHCPGQPYYLFTWDDYYKTC